MNNKGFTLIELIAIIVVLVAIFLVSFPSLLNITKTDKEKEYDIMIDNICLAGQSYIYANMDKHLALSTVGGDIQINVSELIEYGNVDKNTKNPKTNLSVKTDIVRYRVLADLSLNCEYIEEGTKKYTCKRANTLHEETCTQTDFTYYCSGAGYTTGQIITYGSLGTTGLTSGDAFDCDVNADGIYDEKKERFYYVTDLNTETAVLIYYNNTTKGIADNSSKSLIAYDLNNANNLGPTTAVTNLPTTSQWKNVSLTNASRQIKNELDATTTNNGALTITQFDYTGYAARLLTYQEVVSACGSGKATSTSYLNNCNYLFENTKYSDSTIGADGYWLETPISSNPAQSFLIHSVFSNLYYNATSSQQYAMRPVIEVPKSNILY